MIRTLKQFLGAAVLLGTFAVTLAAAMTVTERMPDGLYCGSYAGGLVVGNLSMKAGTDKFDMVMKGLGLDLECKDETFLYDPKTHHATVVGATDPNDCIGAVLTENDLTLDVIYQPDEDIITLDLGFTQIICKKCPATARVRATL
ncbi:hypothetical protein NESM_000433000 [Novymonas esmeraldas]|uniref:Uncharacterized protein n=1 Tax=Novymonas esmeraldas TaxID=1808958 RepID=A0AAW0ELW1_9TRYP